MSSFCINIFAPNFFKAKLWLEKSCAKHFRTKNVHVKCWWIWHLLLYFLGTTNLRLSPSRKNGVCEDEVNHKITLHVQENLNFPIVSKHAVRELTEMFIVIFYLTNVDLSIVSDETFSWTWQPCALSASFLSSVN